MLSGENGIIAQAQEARENTRGASVKEEIDLWKSNEKMDGLTNSETAEEVDELLGRLVENRALTQEEADKLKDGETIKIEDYLDYDPLEGARSITVEDINKVTGYNPNNVGVYDINQTGDGTKFGEGNLYEY